MEMEQLLEQSLEAVVCLELYPRSEIVVNVNVLEADGSLICVVMNAACLAIMDAGVNMGDMVCACSAGMLKGRVCTDFNQIEQGSGAAYMPVAIRAADEGIIFMHLDSRLAAEELEQVLNAAIDGCRVVKEFMAAAIRGVMKEGY